MKYLSWMTDRIKKSLPLILAVVLFSISLLILTKDSLNRNQGHLVYALDDGYIHMATAKNLAEFGVWGVTRYEFSSNSSSLLWTVVLAAVYWVFGPSEVAPFILNILFCVLSLVVVARFLREMQLPGGVTGILLVAAVYTGTMPILVFVGMEHGLEVFLDILFIYQMGKYISNPVENRNRFIGLAVLAALVTGVRYEGLFVIGAASLVFFLRKRFSKGLLLLLAGLFPIVLYGVISLAKGGLFFPNSILLKGSNPTTFQIFDNLRGLIEWRYNSSKDVIYLAGLSLLVFVIQLFRKTGFWDQLAAMNLVVFLSNILQTFFIGDNYFYRYESNLIVGEIMVLGASIYMLVRERASLRINRGIQYGLALVVVGFLFWKPLPALWQRSIQSMEKIPPATTNIYEQQYQMALFLREYYQGKTIAANDIGAINYLADIHTVDLYGLSTQAVADMKLEGVYSTAKIRQLAIERKVDIAIVYDHWFDGFGGLPRDWVKDGEWSIRNNVVCGGSVVSFYAIKLAAEPELMQNLKAFSPSLPTTVGRILY